MKNIIVGGDSGLNLGDPQSFHVLRGVRHRVLLRQPVRLKSRRLRRLFAIVVVVLKVLVRVLL